MTVHHHLRDALRALLDAIERKDAEGAQLAMEQALTLFAETPAPGDDEGLAPLMAKCESAARAFHAALGVEVRESATSARASHAYATGGRREQP
jgi:hypothetical protein